MSTENPDSRKPAANEDDEQKDSDEDDNDNDDEEQVSRLNRSNGVVMLNDNNNNNNNTGSTDNSNNLPLDWTQLGRTNSENALPLRYPSDVADIDPEETEIILVGTAGQKITRIGPDFSASLNPQLKELILRSHLIRTMEGLQHFTKLELLELYDNQVNELSCLNEGLNGAPGATLRVLDMSFNVIRDMAPVAHCPNLQELYLANNKLKSIEGLKGLKSLRKIDLGANKIRVMNEEELSSLENLEELWLGKNKIEEIRGLERLKKLRRLDVQSNRLTAVEGLTAQVDTLEELYLAHNGITTEGASVETGLALPFTNLSVLDLSRNRLTSTAPFSHLTCLDELWLSGNKINSFDDAQPLAALGESLDTIYLEHNPLQQNDPLYRKKLAELIPSVNQIDANLIGGGGSMGHGAGGVGILMKAAPPTPTAVLGGLAQTKEEQLRQLQEMVVQRAKEETTQGQQAAGGKNDNTKGEKE